MSQSSDEQVLTVEREGEVKAKPGKGKEKPSQKPKRQPLYNVIIWNDETHTYEYVIELLMRLFGHEIEKAYQITKEVDKTGRGVAFTTHQELAELKRDQILAYGADWRMAKSNGPIRSTIEPVE